MKRKLLIAGIATLALILIGAGGYLAWNSGVITFKSHDKVAANAPVEDAKPVEPPAPPREGMTSVRKLFQAQDRIAKGDIDAIKSQNEIIDSIANEFNSFTKADWAEPKNVQAMMAYVLSGGKAEVVEKFLSMETASKEQEQLAKGVLSFALRRPKTAIKQIGDVETRSLDRPLVGVVALALASLHATENADRSVALFDDARLHAPSTAVEEAAIRREVPLLLKANNTAQAEILVSRYVRVFGQSPYAPRFYGELANGLSAIDEKKAQAMVTAVSESLSDQLPDLKSNLFLRVARTALIAGKVELARDAADVVAEMSSGDAAKLQKAKLYAAAAIAVTENAGSVLPDLQKAQDANFDDDEKSIRMAAETIARSVVEAGTVKETPALSESVGNQAPDGVSKLVNKADSAVQEADRLISSVKN